jgi:hypothetical protein
LAAMQHFNDAMFITGILNFLLKLIILFLFFKIDIIVEIVLGEDGLTLE